MQVLPSTARDPGFGIRPSSGTAADDVRVGNEYLSKMHDRYGGDLAKMWAAYNAGPGTVDKLAKQYGVSWWRHLPAETLAYLDKNLGQVGAR